MMRQANAFGNSEESLVGLVRAGNYDELRRVASLKAHTAEYEFRGFGAIHVAAEEGDLESLRILVDAGIGLDLMDSCGLMPVHIAAIYRRVVLLSELLQLGADLDVKDSAGSRPLHHAAMEGAVGCIALLLAQGSDVNGSNFEGSTPLHFAARGSSSAAVYLLLLHGAVMDVVNDAGESPSSILLSTKESLIEWSRHDHDVSWQLTEIEAALFLLDNWPLLSRKPK